VNPRKILFITGSRGEYGYIRPILRLIENDPDLNYQILATNMHLLPEFGDSINEFAKDGFTVDYRPLMTFGGFTPQSMVKSLSALGLSLVDILDHSKPDIILLAGDRGEQLMAAIAGSHMNIPVAHIQAGELSGNIDGLARHAIARFSHIHFASNPDAENRLIKSGEQDFRVFNVGAPQLDEFISGVISSKEDLKKKYGGMSGEYILFVQHSVTEQHSSAYEQVSQTLKAIAKIGMNFIVIAPNSDAGSALVNAAIMDNSSSLMHVYRNVSREDFAGLMKHARCIVGNSSSGLLEAPTFELPAVNIGRRQEGRFQGINVINCDHDIEEITSSINYALSENFKSKIRGMENPYGDGKSSRRIIKVLKEIPIDEKLLMKKMAF
jgi:GDP/UDP-N,N'-diacetylbacillosamine 2-epimerase (hydrolysing)